MKGKRRSKEEKEKQMKPDLKERKKNENDQSNSRKHPLCRLPVFCIAHDEYKNNRNVNDQNTPLIRPHKSIFCLTPNASDVADVFVATPYFSPS